MTPVEERLDALERRMERLEALLIKGQEAAENPVPREREARPHRVRQEEIQRAIARASAEEYRTFVAGMKLVGGLLLAGLLCWLGYSLYQEYCDDQASQIRARSLMP